MAIGSKAAAPATQGVATLSDVAPNQVELSNPTDTPIETRHASSPTPKAGLPAEGSREGGFW